MLSLGRRLVNLLPVAQPASALTNGVVEMTWAAGREFNLPSTMKTFFNHFRTAVPFWG